MIVQMVFGEYAATMEFNCKQPLSEYKIITTICYFFNNSAYFKCYLPQLGPDHTKRMNFISRLKFIFH